MGVHEWRNRIVGYRVELLKEKIREVIRKVTRKAIQGLEDVVSYTCVGVDRF